MCTCMHVHMEARSLYRVPSSITLHLSFLRQIFSKKVDFTKPTQLPGQSTSGSSHLYTPNTGILDLWCHAQGSKFQSLCWWLKHFIDGAISPAPASNSNLKSTPQYTLEWSWALELLWRVTMCQSHPFDSQNLQSVR